MMRPTLVSLFVYSHPLTSVVNSSDYPKTTCLRSTRRFERAHVPADSFPSLSFSPFPFAKPPRGDHVVNQLCRSNFRAFRVTSLTHLTVSPTDLSLPFSTVWTSIRDRRDNIIKAARVLPCCSTFFHAHLCVWCNLRPYGDCSLPQTDRYRLQLF